MAEKMAMWRLNRKNFERRRRLMLLAKANDRFLDECERLNEGLSQSHHSPTNTSLHDGFNVSVSANEQSQVQIDDYSLPSFTSQVADEPYLSGNEQETFATSPDSFTRPIEKIDLAAALIALKIRHSLSAVCINDICSLLCILNVPNAPRSWFHVDKALVRSDVSSLDRKLWWICPRCKKASDNAFYCSNVNCGWSFSPPAPIPTCFYTFNIIEQLCSILATTTDLCLPTQSKDTSHPVLPMTDIIEGDYYRKILDKESNDILTLTMSTDGIQPFNCSEKSIWPVTFIINEIKRKKRFSFQNLIIGGVWPGPAKPKRFEMTTLMETIVEQLRELEKGCHFECRSGASYVARLIKRYYQGYSVRSSHKSRHHINCFPIENSINQPHLRSNDRYDHLLSIKQMNDLEVERITSGPLDRAAKRELKRKLNDNKESEHGILGPCVFRQLKYFDVGFSFVSDSLHNVYHGVVRKLLKLWLHSDYKKEQWSCHNHLHQLSAMLQSFRFPSTTARRPRSLVKFQKLKANELRMVLLFGFVIFKKFLKPKYYDHFLKLVVAIHFAEYRALTITMVENVISLLREFLIAYPKLYTVRHNHQVVHSLNHIGQTINDYGPLTSYSTFHFENILGMIMRTIKGTRREEIEMIGNLNTFRRACLHLHDCTMNYKLKTYVEGMVSGRGYYAPASTIVQAIHPSPAIDRISTVFSNPNLRFFSTCKVEHIRYTSVDYSKSKVVDDSAVIFRLAGEYHFGLITSIFTDADDNILLELWPISNAKDFKIVTNGQNIDVSSIQEGTLENNDNFYYIPTNDIVEKCVYWRKDHKKVVFYRFPNLEESS